MLPLGSQGRVRSAVDSPVFRPVFKRNRVHRNQYDEPGFLPGFLIANPGQRNAAGHWHRTSICRPTPGNTGKCSDWLLSQRVGSASPHRPAPRAVVVGITHVTLGDEPEKNHVFWDYANRVIDSLPEHEGYLGHKMRRKLFKSEAWTMTLWENDQALNRFVRGQRHSTAMGNGLPAVKSARFVRLILPHAQTPPDWATVEKMMSEKGRNLY